MIILISTLALLAVIHLVIYPLVMQVLARRSRPYARVHDRPRMVLWVPVYNEGEDLAAKLDSILKQDYPSQHWSVELCLDGCQDNSEAVAKSYRSAFAARGVRYRIWSHRSNQGKVYRLNQQQQRMAASNAAVLVVSDATARLPAQALTELARGFVDPRVGALTARYCHQGDNKQSLYWKVLSRVRSGESALGCVQGGTGALLAVRREALKPLPESCINDDFVLVIQALASGYLAKQIDHLEVTDLARQEDWRSQRRRIAAGNLLQVGTVAGYWRSLPLVALVTFCFGKGMRSVLPMVTVLLLLLSTALAPAHPVFGALALMQWAFYLMPLMLPVPRVWRLVSEGLMQSALGQAGALIGWRPAWCGRRREFQPMAVRRVKRLIDVLMACILLLTLPLWPLVALAIRLDSPGPVFYRQLRVGRVTENLVGLFYLIKFRTMVPGSDGPKSGWTRKSDPRVTRVGHWLRATRIDELPQLINVLAGEMSLIGPRPERPSLCGELDQKLPFYQERTYEVLPGLTGLAQVNNAGDTCIEDVANKLYFDHAYAASLSDLRSYLRMEWNILWRTFVVVVTAKGH
ncbi:sugar transferase [Marinobacter hydrocarbonoclasticus]|nr:sugar transferase [Marinobacter nauticus]